MHLHASLSRFPSLLFCASKQRALQRRSWDSKKIRILVIYSRPVHSSNVFKVREVAQARPLKSEWASEVAATEEGCEETTFLSLWGAISYAV